MSVSESINWSTSASIIGGPVISRSGQLLADGYDKFEVVLTAGGGSKTLAVAPGNWEQLQFLLISPSQGDPLLTYNSGDGNVALSGPLFLVGGAATALLGSGKPATLALSNGSGSEITVDILVARSA